MTPEEAQQIAAASLLVSGVTFVIAIGLYVWYAFMLAKVFAQYGRPAWSAWVPVYNEMQVFRIGGQQPWLALLLYVPLAQVVGLVFKVFALHRISRQSWRGVGTTVLGVLLPPVWATVLAVGPSPDPERGRMSRTGATGSIPPVQPSGPLAAPYPEATTGGPLAAPRPAVDATPVAASAHVAPAPIGAVPITPAPAAPVRPAAQPTTGPLAAPAAGQATPAPDPASSPFAPPSAFGIDEPPRVPGRIEPLPPMPGAPQAQPQDRPAEAQAPGQAAVPSPAPAQAPTFATLTNPFMATPPVAPPTGPVATGPAAGPVIPASLPAFAPPSAAATGAQAVASPLDAFEVDDAATIVTGDEDPFDRTVVVDRRPAFQWRLVLADGTALPLEAPTVMLGRNPRTGDAAARALVVPDPSRTLSKTHAMIQFDGAQWWITDLDSTNGVLIADGAGTDQFIEVGVATPFTGRFVLGTLEARVEPDPTGPGALY
ncbi:DUF5684 domain-containing protein [Agromyces salentinus]|uniref:FHA domain-containing protein n=1 Tax=Agromyces salentinus TaxID=269421 RepID=A0ABN2MX81_9MICO|nr:DUF5684 domain-containing protein [Agromyces salentinus]